MYFAVWKEAEFGHQMRGFFLGFMLDFMPFLWRVRGERASSIVQFEIVKM